MRDIKCAIDGIERLRFFNQREGRELWASKPENVQNEDIASADAIYADVLEILNSMDPGPVSFIRHMQYGSPVIIGNCPSCRAEISKNSCPKACGFCGKYLDWDWKRLGGKPNG